jgi:hypothetical protein
MKILILIFTVLFEVNASYDEVFKHLKDRETFATVGYVPTDQSGVTIGIGIDLGQQTKKGLEKLNIDSSIIRKLEPYLGLTSKSQLDKKKLKASNLQLTAKEAEQLSKPFIMDSYNVVQPYAKKMDSQGKGLATLVSLRHWAGSLGCTKSDCKLVVTVVEKNGKSRLVNYVWDAIKDFKATKSSLKTALENTFSAIKNQKGTARYNRIKEEIAYLS